VGTRAAAENEKGAVLLGYSPEFLALANWIIASVLAALAGLLVGQLAGALDPGRYTLFIVPALGAALIAGLSSVLLAVIGGLGLGMIQSFVGWWSTDADFFPDWASSGIRDAIPLLIIALVLFLRGKSLPIRGTVAERRLALSPRPVRVLPHALIWPAAVLVLASIVTGAWELAMTTSLITAILMLSYVVLTGYVGQISLAQLTLAGVSAFFMVRLMSDGTVSDTTPFPVDGPGWPMIVAMPLAVALAVIVGVLIGLPALRIRGVQLAVVTIAAGLAISSFYFNNPQLTDLEAGSDAPVPPPDLFGADLGIVGGNGLSDNFAFTAFCVVMVSLCAVAVANLRRATTGRRFLAVRANERAAAAAGVDVSRTKLLAFGISSALAGIAGCMFAFQFTAISSSNWEVFLGLAVLAFAYLGGITSVNGALVGGYLTGGGFSAVFGEYHFEGLDQYLPIMGGLGLVLTAIIHPEGIAPFFQPLLRHAGNAMLHNRWPEWRRFLVRVGPTALAGAIFGWVVWARQDHFNNWMILVGIGLFLFVRAIILRILAARRGEGHVHPGAGHGPGSSPASAPEAVLAEGTSAPVAAAGAGSMEVSR
jgi:branched-chain amino acid transport system permease protein